ncbi:hypothetical protein KI387_025067, partial [Taxus chinensis]
MAKANPAKESMDGVITDKRFSRLHSDPRFTRLPRNNSKVQIDSRFQRMFSDKNFSESLSFDKRGRPKKTKEKNKLLEYYYHRDQEEGEEEEDEENAIKQAEENNEDKSISRIDAKSKPNVLSCENSSEKTYKKNKKNEGKHEKFRAVSGHVHGVSVPEDDNLDNVRGTSDSKKKKKKKECKMNDKFDGLHEAVYTEGGPEGDEGTQLMKMKKKNKNKIIDNKFDLSDDMFAEEGSNVKQGAGSIKKKKKNDTSSGLNDTVCTEEVWENNREVELKKKKKNKSKVNNDLGDSEERMHKGKYGAEVHGLEQVKEDNEQVRTLPEEEVLTVSSRYKDASNSSKKMKGGGRLGEGTKHASATDKLNVAKGSQKEMENMDIEKQKEKQNSILESGKKRDITVEGFSRKHQQSEDDQELSESESFSGEDADVLESEESETSLSSSDEDDNQIELESPEKEEVTTVDHETRRLAVVNMDWNHIKAVDLIVMMNSFLPKGGRILSIGVYPSEFGLKQMEEEAVRGPDLFGTDDDSDEDEETEIDNEKLRQYEKARLRYYYAVIECDSSATADYLYKACDGVEFERTSNVMDLRFIPDDMEFNHPPRDVATEVPTTYEAPDFHTRALQHSKVNISWDDDEPLRVKTLNRKYDPKQLNEMDFKAYLASDDDVSDSDEDGEGEEDVMDDGKKKDLREKYRSLLLDSGDPLEHREDKDDKDMEITFNTGLEELSKRILEKNKNKSEETVWESYLKKRNEKRKARKNMATRSSEDESDYSDREDARNEEQGNQSDDFFLDDDSLDSGEMGVSIAGSKVEKVGKKKSKSKTIPSETKSEDASKAELELLLTDDHGLESSVRGYNLKPKKSKGRKLKESPVEDKLPTVDTDDPRFSALFTSHHFAIDPTDPQFKRSATYSRSIVQKQQKKFADKTVDGLKATAQKESKVVDSSTKKRKTELSSLIKSVKRK